MKFYIATRFDKKDEVHRVYAQLQKQGHEISADWTKHELIKPYDRNALVAQRYAAEDFDGARNCDVFIIISNDAGTGMYTELGAAIASHIERGKPLVYCVGAHTARSMFYFHPSVKRRETIDDVLKEVESMNKQKEVETA